MHQSLWLLLLCLRAAVASPPEDQEMLGETKQAKHDAAQIAKACPDYKKYSQFMQ
jgi:hypothetical protein